MKRHQIIAHRQRCFAALLLGGPAIQLPKLAIMRKGRHRVLAAALQQTAGPAQQLQTSAAPLVRLRGHELGRLPAAVTALESQYPALQCMCVQVGSAAPSPATAGVQSQGTALQTLLRWAAGAMLAAGGAVAAMPHELARCDAGAMPAPSATPPPLPSPDSVDSAVSCHHASRLWPQTASAGKACCRLRVRHTAKMSTIRVMLPRYEPGRYNTHVQANRLFTDA